MSSTSSLELLLESERLLEAAALAPDAAHADEAEHGEPGGRRDEDREPLELRRASDAPCSCASLFSVLPLPG